MGSQGFCDRAATPSRHPRSRFPKHSKTEQKTATVDTIGRVVQRSSGLEQRAGSKLRPAGDELGPEARDSPEGNIQRPVRVEGFSDAKDGVSRLARKHIRSASALRAVQQLTAHPDARPHNSALTQTVSARKIQSRCAMPPRRRLFSPMVGPAIDQCRLRQPLQATNE